MISLVLDYNMLAGREDSVFARRYVMPLVQSGAVKIVRLAPGGGVAAGGAQVSARSLSYL